MNDEKNIGDIAQEYAVFSELESEIEEENINSPNREYADLYDKPSIGWNILGFIFPLMGFVLAIIWRKASPVRARSIAIAAAAGLVLGIAANLLVR